ncbi:hypothetical protein GCM10011607_11570 [Shewanella inventionis]|uniref:Uncharacterized protein n=1 Tax=Shewanella inventionis TaxID=1738770 RepID=A0ABQ1IWG0_9GAMM|nr:hypothetical protein [Shewanella inventionis]GGB52739.1 hypothetical protein GCM10011607_11570 [Shewanella inventionis]
MSKLQLFEKAVNKAITSKGRSERLTIPVQVEGYDIDPNDAGNSSVIGHHYFTKEKMVFRINKSSNPNQPTVAGFQSLEEGADPKFEYSVPKNGVIMFMDCKKQEDGSYTAEWAKSTIRKSHQALVSNFSTVKAVRQYGDKPPYIVFDSYIPKLAKSLDLRHVKSANEIKSLIVEALEPKLGVEANRSIALLRIMSSDTNEKVMSFEITGIKKSAGAGKQQNCTGEESFEHFTKDGMGKVIFKDGAVDNLLGSDLTVEVVPGISYFVAKSTSEQYFYTSDEIKSEGKDASFVGTLKPKTIMSVWTNMLNKVEFVTDEDGSESKVRKPKVMNVYLTTAQLQEDKTKLVTAFNTETTNQKIYDLSELPTEAFLRVRGLNSEVKENISPKASTSNAVEKVNTAPEVVEKAQAKPQAIKDDYEDNMDFELSEDDMAELNEISRSMRTMG